MCPEVLYDEYGKRIKTARPDSGFIETETHAFYELTQYQLKKRDPPSYARRSRWTNAQQHEFCCPIGLTQSSWSPFWVNTQLITPAEDEVFVWWLCKLGRLPFQYHERRLAKQRTTSMVGLGSLPTRAWLRGFGTICASREQVKHIIRTLEKTLAQQEAWVATEDFFLDTCPATLAPRRLRSCDDRPLGEYIWTEWPADSCPSAVRSVWKRYDTCPYPHQLYAKKKPDETWLCPIEWRSCTKPAPFDSFLDPVIVLGHSLHALREREEAWPLRLREDFQEMRSLYEYAAALLSVRSLGEWRTVLATRPPKLKVPVPRLEAESLTDAQQERRRVLVPHPDAPTANQDSVDSSNSSNSNSGDVYAQLSGAAHCPAEERDLAEARRLAPPMSAGEAQLGKVYDEILLLLEAAWREGRLALSDTFEGWDGVWPRVGEDARRRLEELLAQKADLLFELQPELKVPSCTCPLDEDAVPPQWRWG